MYGEIYQALKNRGRLMCATLLEGEYVGSKLLFTQEAPIKTLGKASIKEWEPFYEKLCCETSSCRKTIEGRDIFIELYEREPHMVICGGGHISVPVYKMAKMLGFHVTVLDDREEFANWERFPDADICKVIDFSKLEETIPDYENTYYVIVTRGHSCDEICARQILDRNFAYFGMIGSKGKIAATRKKLEEAGYTKEKLDLMHAPIGIKIGGDTPAEIAVSILAEIVQVKNQRQSACVPEEIWQAIEENSKGRMVTIIEKSGSSPRGVGSKMWLDEEGRSYGTIGGGTVEYQAIQDTIAQEELFVREYCLSNKEGSSLGMICGGDVCVLSEIFL